MCVCVSRGGGRGVVGGGSAGKIFDTMLLHSLSFDMQHDNVLENLNFDPTPMVRGLRGKNLIPCCCIRDSL